MASASEPLLYPVKQKRTHVWVLVVVAATFLVAGVWGSTLAVSSPSSTTSLTSAGPQVCTHSVVGAGWGGIYYIWRLALSPSAIFSASDFCLFEASSTRLGGRSYSFRPGGSWEDVASDVGAYRFAFSQQLAASAIKFTKLPTVCWAGTSCGTTGYYVIRDSYGNNNGHQTPLQSLLNSLLSAGLPPVNMAHQLVNIQDSGDSAYPVLLTFANGAQVKTQTLLLNIPRIALDQLDPSNILQTQTSTIVRSAIRRTVENPGAKQFVWYSDAWWLTKLNLTTGTFSSSTTNPAMSGNYGDGPVKCVLPNGTLSSVPVKGGNCRGAIRSIYQFTSSAPYNTYFNNLYAQYPRSNADEVMIELQYGQGYDYILNEAHNALMTSHATKFQQAGISSGSIPLPTSVIMGYWNSNSVSKQNPSYSRLSTESGGTNSDSVWEQRNLVILPLPGRDIFIANEAWSNSGGWAEGSLILVERLLTHRYSLARLSDVSTSYYTQSVLPYMPAPLKCQKDPDCAQTLICAVSYCQGGVCVEKVDSSLPCDDENPCTTNYCSVFGECVAEPVQCPTGQTCHDGKCVINSAPPLPKCTYSNSVGGFQLYWEFNGNSINIAYRLNGISYAGLGLGSSMAPADIIMGWVDVSPVVGDYYSAQSGTPKLDTTLGGTDDLTNTWATYADGATTVWFTRLLNTGDSYDQVIVKNQPMSIIYAWYHGARGGQLAYHGENVNAVEVTFADC